jgi:hypothetical protein
MVPVRPVLHQLSCSNKTVRNAPKHELSVQWSGSGAFVAKNSNSNSCRNGKFCIDFRAVTKRSETLQNMSFGSNGVGKVRSFQKISTQLRLVNLCVNGASSASFALTFVQ